MRILRPALSALWAWLGRHPIKSLLIGLFLVTLYVPIQKLMPLCVDGPHRWKTLEQPIDSEFMTKYRESLADLGVENWEVGGVVYVRWWIGMLNIFLDSGTGKLIPNLSNAQGNSSRGACQRIAEQESFSTRSGKQ